MSTIINLPSSSDGPKQSSAEISAEVLAKSSAETKISVIRTEISVDRHNKEMSFRAKSARNIFFSIFSPDELLLLMNIK